MEACLENDGNVCQCCYLLLRRTLSFSPFSPSLFLSPSRARALSLCVYAAKMHNITSPLPMKSTTVISVLPSASKGRLHQRLQSCRALSDMRCNRGPLKPVNYIFFLYVLTRIAWGERGAYWKERFHSR